MIMWRLGPYDYDIGSLAWALQPTRIDIGSALMIM
jgi:hypothetical protein